MPMPEPVEVEVLGYLEPVMRRQDPALAADCDSSSTADLERAWSAALRRALTIELTGLTVRATAGYRLYD